MNRNLDLVGSLGNSPSRLLLSPSSQNYRAKNSYLDRLGAVTASVGAEASIYSTKQAKKIKFDGAVDQEIQGRSTEHIALPSIASKQVDTFQNTVVGTRSNVSHIRATMKLPDIYSSPRYEEFSLIDSTFNTEDSNRLRANI